MPRATPVRSAVVEQILGYLNFSSGKSDAQFLQGINRLFAAAASPRNADPARPTWRAVRDRLAVQLAEFTGRRPGFERSEQAQAVLGLVFDHVLPAYRRHHGDLLAHHTDESLFRPLFVGRACEAVLAEGRPWEEIDRVVRGALRRLNDFLGVRPLAVLEGKNRLEPFEHERARPIPLWIAGVGAEAGRYHDLIEATIAILAETPATLLRQAWFDPELLEELAVDPRAYDFNHPASRRPNHQFGLWDPDCIDNRGHYRRFVLQDVTLEAIRCRMDERPRIPRKETLFEAAAVLAGTILMGSGICGDGPGAHDSSTTLANLLPHIAGYRDAFYEELVGRVSGRHASRLAAEAVQLHQPFGGARQHLNQFLVRRRASQLQHVHLARLFARMGYAEAAAAQARIVPVASARMQCDIECRVATAHLRIDQRRLDDAARLVAEIEGLLHRAIECGALVDPRNILGFDAQFSLFPAVEDSCYDQRIDDLLDLMESLFALFARLEREAAAAGDVDLQKRLSDDLESLAEWWDQFATTAVSSVEGISGRQTWESAKLVAESLGAWHRAGTAAGDVAFWREHVQQFTSPKAYAQVVEALLDQRDLVAAMALLMQWLSQAEAIPLVEGPYSFHQLALRWMNDLWATEDADEREEELEESKGTGESKGTVPFSPARNSGQSPARESERSSDERWAMTRKFMDFLEAGGEAYWTIPRLELASPAAGAATEAQTEDDVRGGLYGAAYENVTYRDSTDDGFEGEIFEQGADATDFELSGEAQRISKHLAFSRMLARLWYKAAGASAGETDPARTEVLASWRRRAMHNRRALADLLDAVRRYPIAAPGVSGQTMVEFDRRQSVKEMLLDRIIAVAVETTDAARRILVTGGAPLDADEGEPWEIPAARTLRAMRRGDVEAVRAQWDGLIAALAKQPLLYVPVARGGSPRAVVAARCLHDVLTDLLTGLPRLGLLGETGELLAVIRRMERRRPSGPANITEFDRLFNVAFRGVIRALAVPRKKNASPAALVNAMEFVAEPFVKIWLDHSQRLRLSPIEIVSDPESWQELKEFIQRYGHDIFTQPFMTYGNLRGIVTQGPGAFLEWLAEQSDDRDDIQLLADLDRTLDGQEAAGMLGTIVESILEHFNEYLDYNSSTTQSDRGEMLYTLLDFLRLLANYERLNWHLQPLVWAHDELLAHGHTKAAERWRDHFAEQTEDFADEYEERYEELVRIYALRLRSVADRLGERFVKPLEVDRLRRLVGPAIEQARDDGPRPAFASLLAGLGQFTEEPSGVGFIVPAWLEALEDEAERFDGDAASEDDYRRPDQGLPEVHVPLAEARRRVERWAKQGRKKG
ncbi:MAG: hypothetical protein JW809_13565 [Pirellulales bacterium]|nr:hypothetical protein [Pirellulales bacterium]